MRSSTPVSIVVTLLASIVEAASISPVQGADLEKRDCQGFVQLWSSTDCTENGDGTKVNGEGVEGECLATGEDWGYDSSEPGNRWVEYAHSFKITTTGEGCPDSWAAHIHKDKSCNTGIPPRKVKADECQYVDTGYAWGRIKIQKWGRDNDNPGCMLMTYMDPDSCVGESVLADGPPSNCVRASLQYSTLIAHNWQLTDACFDAGETRTVSLYKGTDCNGKYQVGSVDVQRDSGCQNANVGAWGSAMLVGL